LDATATELLFVIGPMLGALVVTFASPRAGLLGCAVTAAAAIWWFCLKQQPRTTHEEADGPRLTVRELLIHRHRFALLLAFACMATGFAAMSLGIVAFADEHGQRLIAGIFEAAWAFGSLVGGAVAGALPARRTSYVWRRAALVGFGMLLCVFATWSPLSLGIALMLSGLTLAPAIGAVYERLGALTPDGARTEAFGWMSSAATAGGAIGAAISGALIESFGVRYVWLLAAVLAVLATVLLLRIPPDRAAQPEPELPAAGLLGETA
jgi:predicted MFS family arabinose efflux permease